MLRQRLQQKLLQKLSPQQIQLMKLLQVPTANLEQRIKEELEANPALEEGEGGDEEEITVDSPAEEIGEIDNEGGEEQESEELSVEDDVDMSEYYDEDDEGVAEYKTDDPSAFHDPDDDNKTIPVATSSSFHESLTAQVGLLALTEKQKQIALHLIGSIDDDGYLRRDLDAVVDDLVFRQNIETDIAELKSN